MSFYPQDQGMRPAGDAMHIQGPADMARMQDVPAMTMSTQDNVMESSPGKRLGALLQQFSRSPAQFQRYFWRHQMDLVENGFDSDGKAIDFFNLGSTPSGNGSALPLARIKKVMKNDDEVKMISAEAPILFSRACEIFIADLTCRAFMVAEENKRRTIQRSDIASAISRSELFDFLIDIVPRTEGLRHRSASVPIRNAMPSAALSSPFSGADIAPRLGMNDSAGAHQAAPFLSLRPTQQDVRTRLDPMDPSLGMNPAGQPLKGLPKAPLPSDWYSFPTNPMGDARIHPGTAAGLGMSSTNTAPPSMRSVMGRSTVDAPTFMDANSSLSMPPPPTRGSLLNMMPYPMDEAASKGTTNPNE